MMFHYAVPRRATGRGGATPAGTSCRSTSPRTGPAIAKTIDDLFRNSQLATKTGTEQAFNASFATMWGNVGLLMNTIGIAVVFAILLVAANAMMMSARERTREFAVLKTIGFSRPDGCSRLVMVEAGLIADHRRGARARRGEDALQGHQLQRRRIPARLRRHRTDARVGAVIALVLMLASGIVAGVRAARLPVVAALRNVE